jgi:hypothetical protein
MPKTGERATRDDAVVTLRLDPHAKNLLREVSSLVGVPMAELASRAIVAQYEHGKGASKVKALQEARKDLLDFASTD